MRAHLVSLDGQADIPLECPLTLIGRDPECDGRVDSPRVSRRHCCLAPAGVGFAVRDLGSTNGTRINGHRVDAGRLDPGDELAVAQFRYLLVLGEPDEDPACRPGPRIDLFPHAEGPMPGTVKFDSQDTGGPA